MVSGLPLPGNAGTVVGLAVLLAAAGTPVSGQAPGEQNVQDRVRSLAAAFAPQGWRHAGDPMTGRLRQGERDTLHVALRDGGHYALVAVCDTQCRDLGIAVLGETEVALARLTGGDGKTLLEIRAPATRKYRVVVTMARCARNPCAYGVGILLK